MGQITNKFSGNVILLLLVGLMSILVLPQASFAQPAPWEFEGVDDIANQNVGNVGIGTTVPSQKLHVANGGIRLDNNQSVFWRNNADTADFSVLRMDSNDELIFGSTATDGSKGYIFHEGFSATPSLIIKGGRLGISTGVDPTDRLELPGRISLLFNGSKRGAIDTADSGTGNGQLRFYTMTSGSMTTKMTIDHDGNVGIGTTFPATKFEVNDSSFMRFTTSPVGNARPVLKLGTPSNVGAGIVFNTFGADQITLYADNTRFDILSGGFIENPIATSQFHITKSTGRVGIGTTVPNAKLDINTGSNGNALEITNSSLSGRKSWLFYNVTNGTDTDLRIWENATSGSDNRITFQAGGNVGIGTVSPADKLDVAGDVRVGTGTTGCVKDADATVIAGTCSSDLQFKKNIEPFPGTLDKLAQLQPVYFEWKVEEFPEYGFGTARSYGLIAQEVEAVLPGLVTEDEKGYKAVRYSKLPLLLLQGMKEQQTQFEELKAENDKAVKELKAENEALKQRVAKIEALLLFQRTSQ